MYKDQNQLLPTFYISEIHCNPRRQVGAAKCINKPKSNWIINEFGLNFAISGLIRLLNESKFQNSESIDLLNEYSVQLV